MSALVSVVDLLEDAGFRYTKISDSILLVPFPLPEMDCDKFGYGKQLDLLIGQSSASDSLIDLMVPTQMGEKDLPAMAVLATNGKLVGCRIGVADTGNRPPTYLVSTTIPIVVLLEEGIPMIMGQLKLMSGMVCQLCHMAGVHQQMRMINNAKNN